MNNKIILIESQPSLTINYYPGSITLEGKDFYFEVREESDGLGFFEIVVVWADQKPINSTEIESEIIEIFTKGR
jgi:hypothetical protein